MKGRDLLGISFRIIGLLFLSIAGGSAVNTSLLLSDAIRTDGVVLGYERTTNAIGMMPEGDDSGVLYYPVIGYGETPAQYAITSSSGRAAPAYEIGALVTLVVPQDNPEGARVASLMGLWGAAIILGGLGALFLILSYLAPRGFGGGDAGT